MTAPEREGLTEREAEQRRRLQERLKGRPIDPNWLDECGAPHLSEDDRTERSIRPQTVEKE